PQRRRPDQSTGGEGAPAPPPRPGRSPSGATGADAQGNPSARAAFSGPSGRAQTNGTAAARLAGAFRRGFHRVIATMEKQSARTALRVPPRLGDYGPMPRVLAI